MGGPTEELPPWPARLRVPACLLACLTSGVVYGLRVRDTGMALHAWWSAVPWLVVMLHPRLQGRGAFLAFLVSVQVMAMIGIEWLRGQGHASWAIAPFLYWPIFVLTWPLLRAMRRRFPAIPLALAWPVVFTGVEWLRLRLSPGELALCVLGYSQVVLTKLIQVADLAGVAAVTFWVCAINGLLADVVLAATTPGGLAARARSLAAQAAGVALLMAFVAGYGLVRDTEAHWTLGPRIHVLQPNTPRSSDTEAARRIHDTQVVQTLSTTRPDCDLIAWPENSITRAYGYRDGRVFPYFIPDLQRLVHRIGQPILVDGWREAPELGGDVHSAALIDLDGSMQVYDKVRLLPWTEVVPGREALGLLGPGVLERWEGFVRRFVGLVPKGIAGSEDDLAPLTFRSRDGRQWKLGTPICFEIATARVVNRWHRQGVDFLVNQTSEGRLGDSIHETTIAVSGFRAVEGRVSVVRATNDGISALIDPNGRVRELLGGRYTGSSINEAGVFWPQVLIDSRKPTLYTRTGDAFAIACLLLAGVLAIRPPRRAPPQA